MKNKERLSSQKGTILILGLWALGFLTVLSVNLAMGVRQHMILVSRLEKRARLQTIASSAVKKAIAVNQTDALPEDFRWTGQNKRLRFNNPNRFSKIKFPSGAAEVSYLNFDDSFVRPRRTYGFIDEERLININTAGEEVLQRLINHVMGYNLDQSLALAQAIVDWREHRQEQSVKFLQDDSYGSLKDPYQEKKSRFENIEELLLVNGINQVLFDRLKNFVTVYGLGMVNINTATKASLIALGIPEVTATKILKIRRGPDGLDSTNDDYIFPSAGNVFADLIVSGQFDEQEIQQLLEVQFSGMAGATSFFYRAEAKGQLDANQETKRITCVFLAKNGKIVYWREY